MWTNVDQKLHRQYMEAYIAGDQVKMANLQPDPKAAISFKLAGDPRVTKFGRFLRQTSLDELPQLWNVIKGNMSLVGPRPPIAYEVEMYSLYHLQRLATIPGITGLWQVNGRCELGFDDMLRLDVKYIKNQSLILDLKILLLTPRAIISQKGAG
jgi:lipopolysaccharide/colanic/teichoic acid biosynthesis glycosyltransferase